MLVSGNWLKFAEYCHARHTSDNEYKFIKTYQLDFT